jgi:hypothetical protein
LPNVTVSRSRGILVDPTDSNTVYVGTEGGGVLMSTDGGENWTTINDGLTDLTVYAMATDPEDPHTLYAGTVSDGVFVLHVGDEAGQSGGSGSPGTTHQAPPTGSNPDSQGLTVSLLSMDPALDPRVHVLSGDSIRSMSDGTRHANDVFVESMRASTTTKSGPAQPGSVLRHRPHDHFFGDLSGAYNLGTFVVDAEMIIADNHASDSIDACFGC